MPEEKLPSPELVRQDLKSPLLNHSHPQNDNESTKYEKLSIDQMLQKHCGEFGLWQLRHFLLTSLAWALEAFHTMVMIFADREPKWRCLEGSDCFFGGASRSICELETGSWEWIGGPPSSTVAEFNLLCGQKYKVGLVQALFFGGCMIGTSLSFYGPLFFSLVLIFSSLLKRQNYVKFYYKFEYRDHFVEAFIRKTVRVKTTFY